MAAGLDAQMARTRHEAGAAYALRQSLVDLAAVAELLASDLSSALTPALTRPYLTNTTLNDASANAPFVSMATSASVLGAVQAPPPGKSR